MSARKLTPLLLAWICMGAAFAAGWKAARIWTGDRGDQTTGSTPGVGPKMGASAEARDGARGATGGGEGLGPATPRGAQTAAGGEASPDARETAKRPVGARSDAWPAMPGLSPRAVVSAVGVRPGTVVAEVDAGAEGLPLALSEAVGAGGHVFAVETDPATWHPLKHLEGLRGPGNVTVAPVPPGRLGAFFEGRVFDVVFLRDVFARERDPIALLRALRPSLRPGTGRVVLVRGLVEASFRPYQFGEAFLHPRFLEEGEDFPPWRRLPPALQRALRALGPADVLAPEQRRQMAAAFTAMLDDRSLFWEVNAHHDRRVGVASELMRLLQDDEILLARWLVLHYDGEGIFDPPGGPLGPNQRAALRTLNRLALAPYFDRGQRRPGAHAGRVLCPGTPGVTARARRAGLVLEREIRGLGAYAALVFRPAPEPPGTSTTAP